MTSADARNIIMTACNIAKEKGDQIYLEEALDGAYTWFWSNGRNGYAYCHTKAVAFLYACESYLGLTP